MSGSTSGNQSTGELKTARSLNTVATIGAGHAIYTSIPKNAKSKMPGHKKLVEAGWLNEPVEHVKRPVPPKFRRLALKMPKAGTSAKIAAGAAAGGWLTLHSGELAGDIMARRSINSQLQQNQDSKGKVSSMSKNDASIMSSGSGAVRSNGHGVNLEMIDKAWSKHQDRKDTYYVPGHGEQHGTVYGAESTRGERRFAAGAAGVVGGIGGGLFGAALHAKRGGSGRLGAVLGAAGGAGALGALTHRSSKYKSEFKLDNKKTQREMGDYMRSAPQDRLSVTQERKLKQDAHRAAINHNDRHRAMTYYQLNRDLSKAYRVSKKYDGSDMSDKSTAWRVKNNAVMALPVGLAVAGQHAGHALANRKGLSHSKGALVGLATGTAMGGLGLANNVRVGRNRHRKYEEKHGHAPVIEKAYRRVDPEADRQRRIGAYAAGSGVGSAWAGREASRHLGLSRVYGEKAIKISPSKKGVGLAALSAGLGAAGIGSYRHGISVRNQPWT